MSTLYSLSLTLTLPFFLEEHKRDFKAFFDISFLPQGVNKKKKQSAVYSLQSNKITLLGRIIHEFVLGYLGS